LIASLDELQRVEATSEIPFGDTNERTQSTSIGLEVFLLAYPA
jgi:hypothetical protein